MPTKFVDLFAALAAPFEKEEVKWRKQSGKEVPYVTARTVMNRLDNVLGPAAWWDDYEFNGEDSIVCKLTIALPDGTSLTKQDAGGFPEMKSEEDSQKGGASDAYKRAAVKFGVARYLYGDGVARFVDASENCDVPRQPEQATEGSRNDRSEESQESLPQETRSPIGSRSEYQGLDPEGHDDEFLAGMTFWAYLTDSIEHCNNWYRNTFPERIEDLPDKHIYSIADHAELVPYLILKTAEKNLHQKDPRARKNKDVPIVQQVQTLTEVYQKGEREAFYVRRLIQGWLKKRATDRMYSNAPTRPH